MDNEFCQQPTVSVDLQHLQQSVVQCFNQVQLQNSEYFKRAIENAFDPQKLQRTFNEQVEQNVRKIITSEVDSYFKYSSNGRAMVKKGVTEKLDEMFPTIVE